ncbi:hypothetical protein [Paenibacillus sp. GP183]|jgi:hypothetical protein|uniref:hypothetical protein n=1 Tax=Paenibacillus sp. GP183 TaxID=1882751 RepID=UPI00089CDBA7|nr:hypothetical protein [Paenibacillus sp. GP183]SED13124.1 hypothetical protein SAMN05443246_5841 [Paenibacillus sp. GP183]
MALTEAHEKYEKLVEEEDRAIQQLEVCELAKNAMLDTFYRSEREPDQTTVKEILKTIHAIDQRLQSELLDLRLEKNSLARKMKKCT